MTEFKILLFSTIGCRLNQTDTALLTGQLTPYGYIAKEHLEKNEVADVVIVNTCAVTSAASQKSRQAVRKLRKEHEHAFLIVTGCSVNAENSTWLKEEGIDLLLPSSERGNLIKILQHENIAYSEPTNNIFLENAKSLFPFKSRAYLKVQDGCNNFCSYCIVPYARGRERSRDFNEIMSDFKNMLNNGHKEIVLVGVNTCTYQFNGKTLPWLLRQLLEVEGDFRIRLSSAEPHEDIIEIAKLMNEFSGKLCRFLHLPAQHLSDDTLKAMNRKYDFQTYKTMIENIRKIVENIHIGTDLIIGFPTETDDDFNTMLSRAETLMFANTHLFTYSPREGTQAAKIKKQISGIVAQARRNLIESITLASAAHFASSQIGQKVTILIEKITKDGYAEGWTDHYLRLKIPKNAETKKGAFYTLTLKKEYLIDNPIEGKKR